MFVYGSKRRSCSERSVPRYRILRWMRKLDWSRISHEWSAHVTNLSHCNFSTSEVANTGKAIADTLCEQSCRTVISNDRRLYRANVKMTKCACTLSRSVLFKMRYSTLEIIPPAPLSPNPPSVFHNHRLCPERTTPNLFDLF